MWVDVVAVDGNPPHLRDREARDSGWELSAREDASGEEGQWWWDADSEAHRRRA